MKRIWSTPTVIINNNNLLDERHLLKEESKRFKSETKEEKVKMAIMMDNGHLQNDFHYQQEIFGERDHLQSKNCQTECTGTRPGDVSIFSYIG
jgi:hypothetical protein